MKPRRYFWFTVFCFTTALYTQNWNANLMVDPNPSPYLSDWQSDPTLASLEIMNTSEKPDVIIVQGKVYQEGALVFQGNSGRLLVEAGDIIHIDPTDFPDWITESVNQNLKDKISRTGMLPEGDYEACAEAVNLWGNILITNICAYFTIAHPEPPELIYPVDHEMVFDPYPIFQWIPPQVPPTQNLVYVFRLVELLDGQLPEIAIEANYPHYENFNVFDSNLEYPLDGLSLEPGKSYVWQVQALDFLGRPATKNNGYSELGIFTISSDMQAQAPPVELISPEDNALVMSARPVFEWLEPQVTIEGLVYYTLRIVPVLNGQSPEQALMQNPSHFENVATLTDPFLDYPAWADPLISGTQYAWQVTARDHYGYPVTQNEGKSEIRTFTFTPGTIPEDLSDLIPDRLPLPSDEIAWLQLKQNQTCLVQCSLSPDSARIYLKSPVSNLVPLCLNAVASSATVNATVDLVLDRFTREILSGTVNADTRAGLGSPFDLNPAGLPMVIRTIQYDASGGGTFHLQAAIAVFGCISTAAPAHLTLTGDGYVYGDIHAGPVSMEIPLVSNHLILNLTETDGQIYPAQGFVNTDFLLNLYGSLQFSDASEGSGIPVQWATDRSGWHMSASSGQATLTTGSYQLALEILQIKTLTYQPGLSDPWQYDFLLDVTPKLTGSPSLFTLPKLTGLHFTQQGLHFPEADITLNQGQSINLSGMRIVPDAVHIREAWIDIFDGHSQPDIRFDLSISLTGFPQHLQNLAASPLTALNTEYQNGSFVGSIEARAYLSPLWAPLNVSESIGLQIHELQGSLTGNLSDPLKLSVSADFASGQPGAGAATLGPVDNCSLDLDGIFTGEIKPAYSNLNLPWGDWTVHLDQSALNLLRGSSGQAALLRFDGHIALPEYPPDAAVQADGQGRYDLIMAVLDSGEFIISGPFTLPVPAADPVFGLRCTGGAVVAPSGILFNNAAGEIILEDGASSALTYSQNTQISAVDHIPFTGDIAFSESFAFRIRDLNETANQMSWKAVASNALLDTSREELIFHVPGTAVRITQGNWQFSQTATAHLSYAGLNFTNLLADCSNDLNFSFSPFQVQTGQIQLFSGEELIATLDNSGFWPGDIFSGAEMQDPSRLLLPDETIAYIQLKDDAGNWLVDVQDMGLHLNVSTTQSGPVPLVMPGLRYGASSDPQVRVHLDQVIVNKANLRMTQGTIQVDSGELPLSLQNAGLALEISDIQYATADQKLLASIRPVLPRIFSSASLTVADISVKPDGLEGFQHKDPEGKLLASIPVGSQLNCTISEIDGSFLSSDKRLVCKGQLLVDLFQQNGTTKPMDYTLNLKAGQADFTIQLIYDETNGYALPLGKAKLRLTDDAGIPEISIQAPFDQENLIVTLQTLKLSLPELGNGLVLAMENLIIDKNGIQPPQIPTDPSQVIQFGGLDFTLSGEQKVTWESSPPGLTMTLGGNFQIWNRDIPFGDLMLGTDGSFSGTNLLPDSVQTLSGLMALTQLILGDGLTFTGEILPPEPFQELGAMPFTIYLDGNGNWVDKSGNRIADQTITALSGESETGADVYLGSEPLRVRCRLSGLGVNLPVSLSKATGQLDIAINTYWPKVDAYDPGNFEEKIGLTGLIEFADGSITGESWTLEETTAPAFVLGELIRLDIENISAVTQGGFRIELGGSLTLNCLPEGSGGCQFEEFILAKDSTGFGIISSGELNLYGFNISVSNFDYGTDPLSFDVYNANASQGTLSEDSKSTGGFYVTFKASISSDIAGFSGGVDQFIVYKDATQFYLLLDNANFEFQETVKGRLDLEALIPLTLEDFQFQMSVGGSLTVNGTGFAAVGEIAFKEDMIFGQQTKMPSFGLFLGLVGQKITLTPLPITITDVGGGIFFNPTARIEDWVYSNCGLNNESEWLKTSFDEYTQTNPLLSVFILGGVSLPDGDAIKGRVLYSLASDHIRLDNSLTILAYESMKPFLEISAKGHIEAGFQDLISMGNLSNFYLEGNLDVQLKLKKLNDIGPSASLAFGLVHSSGTLYWGIHGNMNIEILNILNADYELIVGNPGFLIEGSIHSGFDISILSVDAGLENALWVVWDGSNPSMGAYMTGYLDAEVAWGLAWARGELGAALLIIPSPYFYGYAELECGFLGWDWNATAWAKWEDGSFDGGLGDAPGMEKVLAEAAAAADAIKDQTNDVSSALGAGSIGLKLGLDEAMMARIINNISAGRTGLYDALETDRQFVVDVLNGVGFGPNVSGFNSFVQKVRNGLSPSTIQQLKSLKQDANTYEEDLETELQNHRNALKDQSDKAKADLQKLQTAISIATTKHDSTIALNNPLGPGTSASAGGVSVPSFQVNTSVYENNKSLVNNYSSNVGTALNDMKNQIAYLDSLRSEIYSVIGPGSDMSMTLEKFVSPAMQSQINAPIFTNMETKFDLYQGIKNQINQNVFSPDGDLAMKLRSLQNLINFDDASVPYYELKFRAALDHRIETMDALADTMRGVDAWEINLGGMCEGIETTTRQFYGTVPFAFSSHTQVQLDTLYLRATRIHRNYITDKDMMHQDLTGKIDVLWDRYAELTEKLYTAYQQFIMLAKQVPDLPDAFKNALSDMENRMKTLEQELYLPAPSSVSVTKSEPGLRYGPVDLSLSLGGGSGTDDIIEYAYTLSGSNFQATGTKASFSTPVFPAVMGQTEQMNFKARYRNTAGLTVESAGRNFSIQHGGTQVTEQTYEPTIPTSPPAFPNQPLIIKNTYQQVWGHLSKNGVYQECYLLNTSSRLRIAWPQAQSASGGIAQYEVAVRTWDDHQTVVDWTPSISRDSASVAVVMEQGKPYEVMVRAKDLAGQTGTPLISDAPLVYNPDYIGFPEGARITASTLDFGESHLRSQAEGPLAGEYYFTSESKGTCRKFYTNHYEIQLLRNGAAINENAWESVSEYSTDITIQSYNGIIKFYFQGGTYCLPNNLPFKESFEIALRVKNNTGEIVVPASIFQIQQIQDATKPSACTAEFKGWDIDGNLLIKILQPSVDGESGVSGIQVAVGRSADDLGIKPFRYDADSHPLFDFGPEKNRTNDLLSCPLSMDGSVLAQSDFVIAIRMVNAQHQFAETVLEQSALTSQPYILTIGYNPSDRPYLSISGILNAQTLIVRIIDNASSEMLQETVLPRPSGSVSFLLPASLKVGSQYTARIHNRDKNGLYHPALDQAFALRPHLPPVTMQINDDGRFRKIQIKGTLDDRAKAEQVQTLYYRVGRGRGQENILAETAFRIQSDFERSIILPDSLRGGDRIYLSMRVSTNQDIYSELKVYPLAIPYRGLFTDTDFYLTRDNNCYYAHLAGTLYEEAVSGNLSGVKLWIGTESGNDDILKAVNVALTPPQKTFAWKTTLPEDQIGPGSSLHGSVCGYDRGLTLTDTLHVQTALPNVSLPKLDFEYISENGQILLVGSADPSSFSQADHVEFRIGSARGQNDVLTGAALTSSEPSYRISIPDDCRGRTLTVTARGFASDGTPSLTCYFETRVSALDAPVLTGQLFQATGQYLLRLFSQSSSQPIFSNIEVWGGAAPQARDIFTPKTGWASNRWDFLFSNEAFDGHQLFVTARYVSGDDRSPVTVLLVSRSDYQNIIGNIRESDHRPEVMIQYEAFKGEQPVAGVQYAIGSRSGATDIRNYPAQGTYDFNPSEIQPGSSVLLPDSTTHMPGKVWISLKAVAASGYAHVSENTFMPKPRAPEAEVYFYQKPSGYEYFVCKIDPETVRDHDQALLSVVVKKNNTPILVWTDIRFSRFLVNGQFIREAQLPVTLGPDESLNVSVDYAVPNGGYYQGSYRSTLTAPYRVNP
ncbi:hypothetical protein JW835_08860 [bacterium]|nr:hypothetical protein [bacterium]